MPSAPGLDLYAIRLWPRPVPTKARMDFKGRLDLVQAWDARAQAGTPHRTGREPNGATLALLRRYERSKGYRYQGRGHYRSGRSVLLSVQKERGGLRAIFGSLWVGG